MLKTQVLIEIHCFRQAYELLSGYIFVFKCCFWLFKSQGLDCIYYYPGRTGLAVNCLILNDLV